MARHLALACGLLLGLVLFGLACGSPAPNSPDAPAAQATDVRRTAVAKVQAIIANKSTPTPPPASTATPRPTCPNAIWWTEARTRTGEVRTIQGAVVATRPVPGGATLLEVGQQYPDPTGVAVLVQSGNTDYLNGKSVCVAGRIDLDEGRPTLQVLDPSSITVLD